jgi:hypothetical protein
MRCWGVEIEKGGCEVEGRKKRVGCPVLPHGILKAASPLTTQKADISTAHDQHRKQPIANGPPEDVTAHSTN